MNSIRSYLETLTEATITPNQKRIHQYLLENIVIFEPQPNLVYEPEFQKMYDFLEFKIKDCHNNATKLTIATEGRFKLYSGWYSYSYGGCPLHFLHSWNVYDNKVYDVTVPLAEDKDEPLQRGGLEVPFEILQEGVLTESLFDFDSPLLYLLALKSKEKVRL